MGSLDSVVSRNRDLAWRIIEGNAFIVDSRGNMLHELNETGAHIWKLLDGKRTLRGIASQISEEFEVNKENAQKDVLDFIQELEKKELIKM